MVCKGVYTPLTLCIAVPLLPLPLSPPSHPPPPAPPPKARVKTDVFGAWADDAPIDHKVAVLYTEQMGDEKRDTVEYTSDAFMGCEHTMLTYTRCMDSAPPGAADHRRPCACPRRVHDTSARRSACR